MRRQSERSRIYLFPWIGSGNRMSVFTRLPNKPFEKIKEIYGEELERLKIKKQDQKITFRTLSEEERKEIRLQVRKAIKKERVKKAVAGFVAVIITAALIIAINHYIEMKLK